MAKPDEPQTPPPHKVDTTAYSASQAPETRKEAEEDTPFSDWRLIPGGPRGSHADVGMPGTRISADFLTDKHGSERKGSED